MATLHCYDKDDELKSFGTATKNFAEILEISIDNIKAKTSLLDTGKLKSVGKKLLALSKAAGPLFLFVSAVGFENVEAARQVHNLQTKNSGTQIEIIFQAQRSHE